MHCQGPWELNTERLFLRSITEADKDAVLEFGRDEFQTEEDALRWIRWAKEKNEEGRLIINFYLWLKGTDKCVGRVYLHSKPELEGEVEIAYGIAEEHRNNGYATEAGKAVVRFAFDQAGQEALAAIVKPENTASRRVIEKLGFEKKGVRTLPDENGVVCGFDYFQLYRNS